MAAPIRYYTQSDEEQKIPELEAVAAQNAEDTVRGFAAGAGQQSPAPSYVSDAGQKQSELFQQIASRGPFRYDAENDPLYKVTRDRYVQNGRMAMKDTMGQAAALTGGYGSSYGQAVGQQAYDRSLQELADVIPALYQTAYSMYQDEGNRLKDLYSMAGAQEARDYDRYRDQLGDWQYERAWQQQQDDAAYGRQTDAYGRLYALIGATGYQPSEDELAAAGMNPAIAEALRNEYLRQTGQLPAETGVGSSGSSGGGYYGTGGSSTVNGGNDTGDEEEDSSPQNMVKELVKRGAPASAINQFLWRNNLLKNSRSAQTKPGTSRVRVEQ